jgi:hypothetical protein
MKSHTHTEEMKKHVLVKNLLEQQVKLLAKCMSPWMFVLMRLTSVMFALRSSSSIANVLYVIEYTTSTRAV